jgi:selenocysteine lyase/cysteine desulfurase
MRDVELYVPQYRGCVALFNLRGIPCEAVAAALDERGLCVRAGLHCAPLAHKTLGTDKTGAVRVSFGIYNTFADIDALCRALNDIIKEYTL